MTIKITGKRVLNATYLVLLLAILGLLLWSKPWSSTATEMRKISVSGQATIEAVPDEYVFNPYFEVKGDDLETAKAEVTKLANDAVDAIKALGVEEEDITLDASSYDQWYWREDTEGVLNAYLTIKVQDKDLAQKVQDYLLTTEAKGQLTSQETFSEEKLKELQAQATEKAIEDARTKAETQAKLFDARIGDVIEVSQDGGVSTMPYRGLDAVASMEAQDSSLPILPGQQDITQSVYVVYEIR